tara:strand:- start:174 stop:479 length:306 start_codon:yes stop_codon:yes gene_type:complete
MTEVVKSPNASSSGSASYNVTWAAVAWKNVTDIVGHDGIAREIALIASPVPKPIADRTEPFSVVVETYISANAEDAPTMSNAASPILLKNFIPSTSYQLVR